MEAYSYGLEAYLRYCATLPVRPEEAHLDTVAGYIRHVRESGFSHSTLQQRLTAVRQWYDYLVHSGRRSDENPIPRGGYKPVIAGSRVLNAYRGNSRGLVPRVKRFPWIPTDEEWAHFLGVVKASTPRARNRLMVALAYDGALRRQELIGLDIDDFDPAHRLLTIRPETSKSAREPRRVTYSMSTSALLQKYLWERRRISLQPGALFLSESNRNRGERITKGTWNDILAPLTEKAGLRPPFATHTFRHLRLTHLARKGFELHEIATYAGHRNLESTMTYIHLSGRELGRRFAANILDVEASLSVLAT